MSMFRGVTKLVLGVGFAGACSGYTLVSYINIFTRLESLERRDILTEIIHTSI